MINQPKNRAKDITILDALAKTRNGTGYFIVRQGFLRDKKAIEFFEVSKCR